MVDSCRCHAMLPSPNQMEISLDDLFHIPDATHLIRDVIRICPASLLGGISGGERERAGKAAGLRTLMLVALGCALFVLFPAESGMASQDLSRDFQGAAT